jgi:Ni/Co efflux regulator RcnB
LAPGDKEEVVMKKILLSAAAIGAVLAVTAPAEARDHHRYERHDRGWHHDRGWNHDRGWHGGGRDAWVEGRFYRGRGYWSHGRWWQHRERHHNDWRYR